MKERVIWGDLDVHWRILLKLILKEQNVGLWAVFICLRTGFKRLTFISGLKFFRIRRIWVVLLC
jgi:hypothetical protein